LRVKVGVAVSGPNQIHPSLVGAIALNKHKTALFVASSDTHGHFAEGSLLKDADAFIYNKFSEF